MIYHLRFILYFLGLSLFLRKEALLHLTSGYIGGAVSDAGLYIWLTREAFSTLLSVSTWFTTDSFYPYGYSLAWSDNFLLPSFIYLISPLSLPLTYNLIMISSLALTGYCTFRLVRLLTANTAVSLVSGTALLTFPFLNYHAGHPQLQAFFFLPLSLEFLLLYVNKEKKSYALLCSGSIVLCFLYGVYIAIFASWALCLILLFLLFTDFIKIKKIVKLGVCSTPSFLFLIPFLLPYMKVKSVFGERSLYEPFFFSATGVSFFASPPTSFLYANLSQFSHDEAYLFQGIALTCLLIVSLFSLTAEVSKLCCTGIGLFLVGLVFSGCSTYESTVLLVISSLYCWIGTIVLSIELWRKRKKSNPYLNVSIFLFVMSSFTALGPLGNIADNQLPTGIFTIFYHFFPGFVSLRAIGRIGLVSALFSSVLVSFYLLKHQEKHYFRFACAMLCAIIITENTLTKFQFDAPSTLPDASKPLLEMKEEPFIVLPMAGELDQEGRIQKWSEFSEINVAAMLLDLPGKRVNGYSGQRTILMKKIPKVLADFPSEKSIFYLKRIKDLRYVLFDSNRSSLDIESRLSGLKDKIKLVRKDDKGFYLFELRGLITITNGFTVRGPSYIDDVFSFSLCSQDIVNLEIGVKEGKHAPILNRRKIKVKKGCNNYTITQNQGPTGVSPWWYVFSFPGTLQYQN